MVFFVECVSELFEQEESVAINARMLSLADDGIENALYICHVEISA